MNNKRNLSGEEDEEGIWRTGTVLLFVQWQQLLVFTLCMVFSSAIKIAVSNQDDGHRPDDSDDE